MIWQLQKAKSEFSHLVNQALEEGPQVVTRHGKEVVVVLAIDEYRRLAAPRSNLLKLLRESPLVGYEIEIERDKTDFGRDVQL